LTLEKFIFTIKNQKEFKKTALKVFRFQYDNNIVYREFCNLLHKNKENVKKIIEIPFLPIQFFKTHSILSSQNTIQITFTSSATTSTLANKGNIIRSKHHVVDVEMYKSSYHKAFTQFYGAASNYVILALLPSYLERDGSSLVYMVEDLIQQSNNPESGFFLNDIHALSEKIIKLDMEGQNIILIGVTYALLDLIAYKKFNLKHTIVMETGGMKGKRKEMIREELHQELCEGFGVSAIHSEYGMTELLSQAYSLGNGIFECPNWMQILIRDTEDALTYLPNGKTGGINVIDLANLYSCSFIATQDLGKIINNHSFEVLGRFDNSDIRGCNLMVV
jgi:hypothetical protein